MPDQYKKNDYNVQCDICSFKRKRSQCRKTWDGLLACTVVKGCWYRKHENDSPPPVIMDGKPVRDARPEPSSDTFVAVPAYWDSILINWEDLDSDYGYWNNLQN